MSRIVCLTEKEWEPMATDAHLSVFYEEIHPLQQRVDYALLYVDKDNVPMAYMTCREMDTSSVYWQYGGSFSGTQGTIKSFKAYNAFAEWHKERYKYISTLIQNENTVMLKMAMKIGFKIVGVRMFEGLVFLEHTIKVNKENA